MKQTLLLCFSIFSLVTAPVVDAQDLYDLTDGQQALQRALPPAEASLSRETKLRALSYERQMLTLDHQQLRLLDALANSSPIAARSMVNGIKAELNYLQARQAGQSFSDFLGAIPADKRVEAFKKGLDTLLSLAPDYTPLDATGVTMLEAVERFETGPIATFRYYLPDTKLEEDTLQRLKLPNDKYIQYFRDNPNYRRIFALRLSVVDQVSKGAELTRSELRLLPYRIDTGFMKDDVDDVMRLIGKTALSGNPIDNDIDLLTDLFSDIESQANDLSKDMLALGLNAESQQFLKAYDNAKRAYLGAGSPEIRAEAHNQMLSTIEVFQSRLLFRSLKNGPQFLLSPKLIRLGNDPEIQGADEEIKIPNDFKKVKVGSVDLSDWSNKTWAQGFKVANNSAGLLRNIAVLAGDDETALGLQYVMTGLELGAQISRGFALMADASSQDFSTASAASFLGGAGLIVGAAVAIQSMSEENAEADRFKQLAELMLENLRVSHATLKQSQQNQSYMLALGFRMDDIESRLSEGIGFLLEGQAALRRDFAKGLAWEASRHFSEAERDAQEYIQVKTLRDEINANRAEMGQVTDQRRSDASAFILGFMLNQSVNLKNGVRVSPSNPNIGDFVEEGIYGFSWRTLNGLSAQDNLRLFQNLPSRSKFDHLFGETGVLNGEADLDRIKVAFDNLYYPTALTGPMATLEELALWAVPTELLVKAYEATSQRANTFLAAQDELRKPILAAAFERLDAFRRLEVAYGNLMLASLSSASGQIDNALLHNTNVLDLRPNYESMSKLFSLVRELESYGVEQLAWKTDYEDLTSPPPRKQLSASFDTTWSGHGIASIGASYAELIGVLDTNPSSGYVYPLHRAQKLGLVRVREVNKEQDNLYDFPYADPDSKKVWGYRTFGTLPITFEGWEWERSNSSVPGTKGDLKIVKGNAAGTLYYSQVIEYLSPDIPLASEFPRTRKIGSYTIPAAQNGIAGVLGYTFEEASAKRWKPIDGYEVQEMNDENQLVAEEALKEARAKQDVWMRVLSEVLRKNAASNRSEIELWFEGLLNASRNGQAASVMSATQTEKTFGVFFKDNIMHPPAFGMDGGYNYSFGDGREFVKKNIKEFEAAVRDIEALNWYIAYALSASYGDCWSGYKPLIRDLVVTLPEYIRYPESVIYDLGDVYDTLPKLIQRDFSSAYKSLEALENLEARRNEGTLVCDPTHRVGPQLYSMNRAVSQIKQFDIAKRLGTIFATSELE